MALVHRLSQADGPAGTQAPLRVSSSTTHPGTARPSGSQETERLAGKCCSGLCWGLSDLARSVTVVSGRPRPWDGHAHSVPVQAVSRSAAPQAPVLLVPADQGSEVHPVCGHRGALAQPPLPRGVCTVRHLPPAGRTFKRRPRLPVLPLQSDGGLGRGDWFSVHSFCHFEILSSMHEFSFQK